LTATGAAEYRLQSTMHARLETANRRLYQAAQKVSLPQLRSALAAARAKFESLHDSRDQLMNARLETARRKLAVAAAALDAMSPLRVLERGYAIAHDGAGHVLRDASSTAIGEQLRLRLWKGELDCRVEGTRNE
jgi:exodeoxyribonuclease VII large subunit